jgi:hypothetical protein
MIELGNCRRSIVQRQECHAAQVSRVEHKPRCLVGETHPVRGNFAKASTAVPAYISTIPRTVREPAARRRYSCSPAYDRRLNLRFGRHGPKPVRKVTT